MRRLGSCCRGFSVVLLAAVLACGCASSPPMRFYTLASIAPDTRPSVAAGTTPVRLSRVTLPGELDRAQLVRRIDSTRLQIDDQDRWAAPLDDMIRRVLVADLAARLPPNGVIDAREAAGGERLQALAVDIHEFYADTSCAVTLQATWILTAPQTPRAQDQDAQAAAPAREVTEQTQVPSSGTCSGPDAVPVGMSRALAQLSDHIAAAVAAPPSAER